MSILSEFKAFAMRGNVVDLAVAVIVGGAFCKIVTALVDGIVMPLIGLLSGGINISDKVLTLGQATVKWGLLLQSVIDFSIISFSIFLTIKLLNTLRIKEESVPKPSAEVVLLTEIRDILNKNSANRESSS